jgi:hypothetical protein
VGVALAALTVGAWFAYSALSGKSLADVLKGGTPPLDPSGNVQGGASTDTGTDTGTGDRTALPSPVDLIPGSGSIVIDNHPVAQWIAKQVLAARAHGWQGPVTSGVRTTADQRQACINVCGNPNGCPGRCARPGTSNHRGTRFPLGAVDVSDRDGFVIALAAAKRAGDITGPVIKNDLPNDRGHFSFTGH